MRTFISINPDEITQEKIHQIQEELKRKISGLNENFSHHIKWESKEKFHLTLFFIGDTNKSLLNNLNLGLSSLHSGNEPGGISFRSGGIGAFPKLRYPRVIYLDLINEDNKVKNLYSEIKLILEKEGVQSINNFHPHITLGRVKRDHKINLSELRIIPDEVCFTASEFSLMESILKNHGSEYSLLKKYKL